MIPEDHGCDCSNCPLQSRRLAGLFVPPIFRPGAEILLVAEAPGKSEEIMGQPLVGASGGETARALVAAGSSIERTSMTNALLCRPPGGLTLSEFLARNRGKKSPVTCCRPRLLREIDRAPALLLMGTAAYQAVYGAPEVREVYDDDGEPDETSRRTASETALMSSRGFPSVIEVNGRKVPVLSTVHPAFVLRFRRWTDIFRSDVAKAIRMVRGQATWTSPEYVFFPTADQLVNVLARLDASRELAAYDVETLANRRRGPDPLHDTLRCIGIGNSSLVTCVPVESCEAHKRGLGMHAWYGPADRHRVLAALADWFGDRERVLVAHNGQYDQIVMEQEEARGAIPGVRIRRKRFDTVIAHHVVWSEYPHDLGFCSSQYTDAKKHKNVDHAAWSSDFVLHRYCMADVAVTAYLAQRLVDDPRLQEQATAFKADMRLVDFCMGLRRIGFGLDKVERDRHYHELSKRMESALVEVRRHAEAGLPVGASAGEVELARQLNPSSHHQLRKYLFEVCEIAPVPEKAGGYTESGDPSVSRDNLFHLTDKGLPIEVERTIMSAIDYREAQKLRGTYCTIEPDNDGRVHANWNPHIVVSGRLSTSNPNLLNIKGPLRSMFCAQPGHKLVFCDKAQLELRIIAWLAQDQELIDAFLSGADVHVVNTAAILATEPDKVTKSMRRFGKTFTYAVQYGAAPQKAWQMIKNFRDENGARPYANFTVAESETLYKRWWKARVAIKQYHEANFAKWLVDGYIDEPIHGRRRYFLDGEEEREAMANFPIQSCKPAWVRVQTRAGLLPIGEIDATGEVWTGIKWAPYTKLDMGEKPLVRLHLANGQCFDCDTEDQLLVEHADGYRFERACVLQAGSRVCRSVPVPLEAGTPGEMTEGDAYWMGYAIGNGSTSRNRVVLAIGNRKGRYTKESQYAALVDYARGIGMTPWRPDMHPGHLITGLERASFRARWEAFGYDWVWRHATKRVPRAVWAAPLAVRAAFLVGLFDADGTVGDAPAIPGAGCPGLHMSQRELLAEVQLLLHTVGVFSRLHGPYVPAPGSVSWRLDPNGAHLFNQLGYGHARAKRARVHDVLAPPFLVQSFLDGLGRQTMPRRSADQTLLHRMRTGGSTSVPVLLDMARKYGVELGEAYMATSVVRVESLNRSAPVYTLSVDDPSHRYDAEGVISKNCAAADVNEAQDRVLAEFPWGFAGPYTGICHYNYDSIGVEVPDGMEIAVGQRVAQLMDSHLGGMPLPMDIQVGPNWYDLTEVER